jgi:hypothetical protein
LLQEEKVKDILTAEENADDKKIPESIATGTAQISILNHALFVKKAGEKIYGKSLRLSFKNIAEATVGEVVFEVNFYDAEGNVLDTAEYSIADVEKDRVVSLNMASAEAVSCDINSYHARVVKVIMTPIPVVTGDERIKIIKHSLRETDLTDPRSINSTIIDLAIRNVSDKTIASAIYEAVYYDSRGNILDTVRHKDCDMRPNSSRSISIATEKVKSSNSKSYKVTLLKTITTDVEKVQLRGNELSTLENGCEEVHGIVKNISDVKTDAALMVNFKDSKNINIGTRVIVLKDLEPGTVRRFKFVFNTPNGEKVKSCSFDIGEVTENN